MTTDQLTAGGRGSCLSSLSFRWGPKLLEVNSSSLPQRESLARFPESRESIDSQALSHPRTADRAGLLYFARFGITEGLIRDTLGTAFSRGGDYADLFFQQRVMRSRFQPRGTTSSGRRSAVARSACAGLAAGAGCPKAVRSGGGPVVRGRRVVAADAGAEGLRFLCMGRTAKDHVLVPHGPAPLPPPRPVPWRALGVDLPIALFGGGVFVVTTSAGSLATPFGSVGQPRLAVGWLASGRPTWQPSAVQARIEAWARHPGRRSRR